MPAMAVGFPAQFLQEYLGRDVCYVYAATCDAGDYALPALPGCPTITVPRAKVAWMFFCWQHGNLESFLSSYFRPGRVDETIQNYSYTDYTGIKDEAGIATDKDITDRLSALMLKLLVILNSRPHLVEAGQCVRPQKIKHGRVKHRELWSPNLIGRGYHAMRDDREPGGPGFQRGQSTYRLMASFSPSPTNMAPVARLSRKPLDRRCLNRLLIAAANQATRQQ